MGQIEDWAREAEQQRKAGIDFDRHARTDRYKKLERKYEQKLKEEEERYESKTRSASTDGGTVRVSKDDDRV